MWFSSTTPSNDFPPIFDIQSPKGLPRRHEHKLAVMACALGHSKTAYGYNDLNYWGLYG
jgi:hypothetical protein